MNNWIWRGLRAGVRTTRYPAREEPASGVTPGLPVSTSSGQEDAAAWEAICPTRAIRQVPGGAEVDPGRCIHCFACLRDVARPIPWKDDYEWTRHPARTPDYGLPEDRGPFGAVFRRSVHILVVDAGDGGAALREVKQLTNPYYNMHRLGFFLTPSPRHADILLVVGTVTEPMREPLWKAYEAMPKPKRVIAVGSGAISGVPFGPSFTTSAGVDRLLPVDLEVPGDPPPPLAILHALLAVTRRKAAMETSASREAA